MSSKANPLSTEGIYGIEVMGDRVIAIGDHDYIATTAQAWDSPERDDSGMPCLHLACLFEQHYLNPHYILHSVFFTDAREGWVVGSKTFSVTHWGQVVLHTSDGGQTWETQYEYAAKPDELGAGLFSVHRLDDVQFIDAQTGWAVGSSQTFYEDGWQHYGALLHTLDGGLTWQDSATPLYRNPEDGNDRDREFFAVEFSDSQNGWALAANFFPSDTIYLAHTVDSGTN